ncbi:cytochrome b5 [Lichtheimia corymbifera JMRC:FSU:9682]|uniref:Cytochrome b5 n=1 Tax=Lichtheimia corymbifera JMRC:FSU:9682 TaxID=1263082 RepID=A0A068S712_9FUNG|nr:cytochrome b5 [Lichtheimia corymbifera JMRC:FSU:9682]
MIHKRKGNTTDTKSEPTNTAEPTKPSPKSSQQSVISSLFAAVFWAIVLFFGASYLITESWTWGYRGKWTNIHTYWPREQLVFTEQELLKYDGSNPNLPIYLAIDGDVYDVTAGRGWYGHVSSYGHFAGRDAARAYVTGCFKDHLTHDLRGLSEAQIKGVEHWKKFYANHHTYYKVGRVLHDPIDPNTPIPPPCKKSVPQKPSSGQ